MELVGIQNDLVEGSVTESQCAALLDPRSRRLGGCDVDFVLAAGGDGGAESGLF